MALLTAKAEKAADQRCERDIGSAAARSPTERHPTINVNILSGLDRPPLWVAGRFFCREIKNFARFVNKKLRAPERPTREPVVMVAAVVPPSWPRHGAWRRCWLHHAPWRAPAPRRPAHGCWQVAPSVPSVLRGLRQVCALCTLTLRSRSCWAALG